MENIDFRALNSQTQEALRIKCVKQVLKGMPQTEASRVFGISRQAIIEWMKLYRKGGIKSLRAKQRGRPHGGSLKQWQAARTVKNIVDNTPEQLKLPFYLWTREAVALLIDQRYGIRLSPWTIGRYLKRWGMTPQKPVRRAFEQNSEVVRQWLKKDYPQIRSRAKREKSRIYWGDEMGLRSDHAVGRSFSLKGKTPIIYGTGQRFGCNMISAITNKGHLQFMVYKHRFNAQVFIGFLNRMKRQVPGNIFLIIDSHPAHRSVKVKKWQKENSRFKIFYLPGYSPELNPDEMLNQDVKSNAVGRNRAHHQKELISNVRGYLRARQRRPDMVQKYFREKHVQYAAV